MVKTSERRDVRPRATGTAQPDRFVQPRQSAMVRFGKRLRDPVNAFLADQSLIGDQAVHDAAVVPGLEEIRPQWQSIRDELLPLMHERESILPLGKISPDHRRIASTPAWKSYFFSGYGWHSRANRAICPQTSQAIDSVPGMVVAFFSIMEPGTHVPRHRGLTKAWLNCHLPLIVPDDGGRCEIAINGEFHRWEQGQWLVFDETFEHEVWNLSSQPRVVLFLQVQRPMGAAGRLASKAIYHGIRNSSFVGDARSAIGATKSR